MLLQTPPNIAGKTFVANSCLPLGRWFKPRGLSFDFFTCRRDRVVQSLLRVLPHPLLHRDCDTLPKHKVFVFNVFVDISSKLISPELKEYLLTLFTHALAIKTEERASRTRLPLFWQEGLLLAQFYFMHVDNTNFDDMTPTSDAPRTRVCALLYNTYVRRLISKTLANVWRIFIGQPKGCKPRGLVWQ